MKSKLCIAALLAAVTAGAVHAQDTRPSPEIGFRSGISFFNADGETISVISVPESGFVFLTSGTVYATLFPTSRIGVEPQLGLIRIGNEDSSSGILTAAVQVNQFLYNASSASPFLFLTGGLSAGFGDSGSDENIWQVGGGAGYRMIVRQSLGVRLEGRYRRLMFEDEGINEFSLLIGLGAVLGSN